MTELERKAGAQVFVTADNHFGHDNILDLLVLYFGTQIALWGLTCALAPVATERMIVRLFKAIVDALGLV